MNKVSTQEAEDNRLSKTNHVLAVIAGSEEKLGAILNHLITFQWGGTRPTWAPHSEQVAVFMNHLRIKSLKVFMYDVSRFGVSSTTFGGETYETISKNTTTDYAEAVLATLKEHLGKYHITLFGDEPQPQKEPEMKQQSINDDNSNAEVMRRNLQAQYMPACYTPLQKEYFKHMALVQTNPSSEESLLKMEADLKKLGIVKSMIHGISVNMYCDDTEEMLKKYNITSISVKRHKVPGYVGHPLYDITAVRADGNKFNMQIDLKSWYSYTRDEALTAVTMYLWAAIVTQPMASGLGDAPSILFTKESIMPQPEENDHNVAKIRTAVAEIAGSHLELGHLVKRIEELSRRPGLSLCNDVPEDVRFFLTKLGVTRVETSATANTYVIKTAGIGGDEHKSELDGMRHITNIWTALINHLYKFHIQKDSTMQKSQQQIYGMKDKLEKLGFTDDILRDLSTQKAKEVLLKNEIADIYSIRTGAEIAVTSVKTNGKVCKTTVDVSENPGNYVDDVVYAYKFHLWLHLCSRFSTSEFGIAAKPRKEEPVFSPDNTTVTEETTMPHSPISNEAMTALAELGFTDDILRDLSTQKAKDVLLKNKIVDIQARMWERDNTANVTSQNTKGEYARTTVGVADIDGGKYAKFVHAFSTHLWLHLCYIPPSSFGGVAKEPQPAKAPTIQPTELDKEKMKKTSLRKVKRALNKLHLTHEVIQDIVNDAFNYPTSQLRQHKALKDVQIYGLAIDAEHLIDGTMNTVGVVAVNKKAETIRKMSFYTMNLGGMNTVDKATLVVKLFLYVAIGGKVEDLHDDYKAMILSDDGDVIKTPTPEEEKITAALEKAGFTSDVIKDIQACANTELSEDSVYALHSLGIIGISCGISSEWFYESGRNHVHVVQTITDEGTCVETKKDIDIFDEADVVVKFSDKHLVEHLYEHHIAITAK